MAWVGVRQLPLPGLEPFRPPKPADAGQPADERALEATPGGATEQQLWLFSAQAVLLRDLERAIDAGEFEAAGLLRARLQAEYGPSPLTRSLEALGRLHPGLWTRPAVEILDAWSEVDVSLDSQPWLRRRVSAAVLARVLGLHPPGDLARQRPQCLAVICNALHGAGLPGATSARVLVRDGLLSKRALDPQDFSDAAVKDLLAEDREPVWLACLGAIRRIWPVSPPSEPDLLDFEDWVTRPEGIGCMESEAARAFWLCLIVAESDGLPAELVLEARKAMKRLDAGLHARYMARLRPTR